MIIQIIVILMKHWEERGSAILMSYMKQALLNICWCCKGSGMCVLIQHWLVPVGSCTHTHAHAYTCSQNYIFVLCLVWADLTDLNHPLLERHIQSYEVPSTSVTPNPF